MYRMVAKTVVWDAWMLSRTAARRRCGLCCFLPLLLLLPLFLAGSMYVYEREGYAIFALARQKSSGYFGQVLKEQTAIPPIIPGAGISDAELREKMYAMFLEFYEQKEAEKKQAAGISKQGSTSTISKSSSSTVGVGWSQEELDSKLHLIFLSLYQTKETEKAEKEKVEKEAMAAATLTKAEIDARIEKFVITVFNQKDSERVAAAAAAEAEKDAETTATAAGVGLEMTEDELKQLIREMFLMLFKEKEEERLQKECEKEKIAAEAQMQMGLGKKEDKYIGFTLTDEELNSRVEQLFVALYTQKEAERKEVELKEKEEANKDAESEAAAATASTFAGFSLTENELNDKIGQMFLVMYDEKETAYREELKTEQQKRDSAAAGFLGLTDAELENKIKVIAAALYKDLDGQNQKTREEKDQQLALSLDGKWKEIWAQLLEQQAKWAKEQKCAAAAAQEKNRLAILADVTKEKEQIIILGKEQREDVQRERSEKQTSGEGGDSTTILGAAVGLGKSEVEDIVKGMLAAQLVGFTTQAQETQTVANAKTAQIIGEQAAQIKSLNDRLLAVINKSESLSAEIQAAKSKVDVQEEKQKANSVVVIAGLEEQLAGLKDDISKIKLAQNAFIMQLRNCCKSDSALAALVDAGLEERLAAIMLGAGCSGSSSTGGAGAGGFATWLNSQFVSRDAMDEKLAALAAKLEKHSINSEDAMVAAVVQAAAARLAAREAEKSSGMGMGVGVGVGGEDHSSSSGGGGAGMGAGGVYVTSTEKCCNGSGLSMLQVQSLIKEALLIFGADKTGMVDYALESAGGSVISTRCSETYYRRTAQYSLFGIPLWYASNSARTVIQPDVQTGQCWAFKGSHGYLVIELAGTVTPTSFSLEHIPKTLSPTGKIDSAPKDFMVLGLQHEKDVKGVSLGNYTYNDDGDPLQVFTVLKPDPGYFRIIELRILSNHGNPEYTCMYRFRVHGTLKKW